MTERLSVLLREEAEALDVPPAATGAILARGRGLRRRRRWTRAAAAIAAVAVVASGTAGVHRLRAEDEIDPAHAADDFASQGAFAVGHELYLGDLSIHWDDSIKALYYTAAGVVVRSGDSEDTNDGISTYTLVTPTGERSLVHAASSDRIPGFEPDGDNFAYADQSDGHLDVVVHDVVTDRELARITVLDHPVESGWDAPPVSIDGDLVWVRDRPGLDAGQLAHRRACGRCRTPRTPSSFRTAATPCSAATSGRSGPWPTRPSWARSGCSKAGTPSSRPTAA